MKNKIQAIKIIRQRTNIGLTAAKELVEEIEPHVQGTEYTQALEATVQRLADENTCIRNDIQTTIRLVDYFVKHPAEWEAHLAALAARKAVGG